MSSNVINSNYSKYKKLVAFYGIGLLLTGIMLVAGAMFIYNSQTYIEIIFYGLFGTLFFVLAAGLIVSVLRCAKEANNLPPSTSDQFVLISEKDQSAKVLPLYIQNESLESFV